MSVLRAMPDANVVISASLKPDSDLAKIWDIAGVEILISQAILEEVQRHLGSTDQRARLWQLLYRSHIVPGGSFIALPHDIQLPDKDLPILWGAIASQADVFFTGDHKHFGPLYGRTIVGVLVESTNDFKARFPGVFIQREAR